MSQEDNFSRREFLQAGVAAGVSVAIPSILRGENTTPKLESIANSPDIFIGRPDWISMSDDASVMAFIQRTDDGAWALYAGPSDELTEIVRAKDPRMFGFQVSGNGEKLVYVSPNTWTNPNQVLCRDIATGNVEETTPLEKKGYMNPKISGDGTTIAFGSRSRMIWVADSNGAYRWSIGQVCALSQDGTKLVTFDRFMGARLICYNIKTGETDSSPILCEKDNPDWVVPDSIDISANGKRVVYMRIGHKQGFFHTYILDEDKMPDNEPVMVVDGHKGGYIDWVISMTNDGKYVCYTRFDDERNQTINFCDLLLGKAYHYPSKSILADAGISSQSRIEQAKISGDGKNLVGAIPTGTTNRSYSDQIGKLVEFNLERDRKQGNSIVIKR